MSRDLRGGGAGFEDFDPDGLGLLLDVLHGFADSRAGGFVRRRPSGNPLWRRRRAFRVRRTGSLLSK